MLKYLFLAAASVVLMSVSLPAHAGTTVPHGTRALLCGWQSSQDAIFAKPHGWEGRLKQTPCNFFVVEVKITITRQVWERPVVLSGNRRDRVVLYETEARIGGETIRPFLAVFDSDTKAHAAVWRGPKPLPEYGEVAPRPQSKIVPVPRPKAVKKTVRISRTFYSPFVTDYRPGNTVDMDGGTLTMRGRWPGY